MPDGTPVSVRLPPDLNAKLRQVAGERGQSVSDVMRTAALSYLGECPTCGQAIPQPGTAVQP